MPKKIGILGSGGVAKALGSGFIKHGYEVILGTRDVAKLAAWQQESGTKGRVGSFSEAAQFGDIIVLAVKGKVAEDVLRLAGAENIANKIIIDATNPIDESKAPVNGVLQFFTSPDESLLERLQKAVPTGKFVKAFNSIGAPFMVDPKFPGGKPSMFICGNEERARKEVSDILLQFGWEVEDMGKMEAARAIESLCILWCIPGMLGNQWTHAFKLLKM